MEQPIGYKNKAGAEGIKKLYAHYALRSEVSRYLAFYTQQAMEEKKLKEINEMTQAYHDLNQQTYNEIEQLQILLRRLLADTALVDKDLLDIYRFVHNPDLHISECSFRKYVEKNDVKFGEKDCDAGLCDCVGKKNE